MHFIVHCLDHVGQVQKRLDNYDAHKAYLATNPVKTLISGPLMTEDGETMIGSCFVVEADSIDAVKAFNKNDPFYAAEIWQHVSIHRFSKRVDTRS